jgi:hypothetical protein
VRDRIPFDELLKFQGTNEALDLDPRLVGKDGGANPLGPIFEAPFSVGQTPQPGEQQPGADREPRQAFIRKEPRFQ